MFKSNNDFAVSALPMALMSTFCLIAFRMLEYVSPFSGLTEIESGRGLLIFLAFSGGGFVVSLFSDGSFLVALFFPFFRSTFVQSWVSCSLGGSSSVWFIEICGKK